MAKDIKLSDLATKVKATVRYIRNDNPEWPNASAYRVTLKYRGRQCTTTFYHGPAICREPDAASVLNCLLSDAGAGELFSFEDFCGDFGYDTDSRKAEATWKACAEIARKLRRLLGKDFDTFATSERL